MAGTRTYPDVGPFPGSKIGAAINQNEEKRMTMLAQRHHDGVVEASPDP
jgi:hypothetical protein